MKTGYAPLSRLTRSLVAMRLQPAGQREDDEDQDDQRGGRQAGGAEAAITQTATKQSKHREDDE